MSSSSSSADQVVNGHAPQDNANNCNGITTTVAVTAAATATTATTASNSNNNNNEPIQEQINEQRRIFLKNTINEIKEEPNGDATLPTDLEPELRKREPPNTLSLNVKYATLPSPSVALSSMIRSPLSPPPKPPMLSRTRSTGSGDGRTPLSNGDAAALRHSITETITPTYVATTTAATSTATTTTTLTSASTSTSISTAADQSEQSGPGALTVSAKHYESLIEELRCPGCAGPMKAPVMLCKSGHSICEQCTRILLMCPLCKEGFTNARSLTIEALCAKAHFGCSHSSGGCTVRMPVALLPWHEQQCIYKPMKCFMGRVWGDCKWQGREVQWKQHLEEQHSDKLFKTHSTDLAWNMGVQRKPLTGYYVFEVHDEMFNFYEIYDKQRILFTMTCTSNRRESKYNYAYEVTLLQPDNEALSLTQKFPVHSEYDKDILLEGTCVSITLNELSRFVDKDKILHYRVSVMAVKSPRRVQLSRQSMPLPMDYQQTRNAGVNGKSVPACMIITRTYKEAIGEMATTPITPATPELEEDNGAGTGLELERKWGTPQLHFNRKYLRNTLNNDGNTVERKTDELRPLQETRSSAAAYDDKVSLCSNSTSYTKKVSDTLRKSFRTLKTEIVELRPFVKKRSTVNTMSAKSTTITANASKK